MKHYDSKTTIKMLVNDTCSDNIYQTDKVVLMAHFKPLFEMKSYRSLGY
jgi:hypothetical protein